MTAVANRFRDVRISGRQRTHDPGEPEAQRVYRFGLDRRPACSALSGLSPVSPGSNVAAHFLAVNGQRCRAGIFELVQATVVMEMQTVERSMPGQVFINTADQFRGGLGAERRQAGLAVRVGCR